jgi:membrane-bound lytic murein transglycosylase A
MKRLFALFPLLLVAACAGHVVPARPVPAPRPVVVRPRPEPPRVEPIIVPSADRAPLPSVPAVQGRAPSRAAEAGLRPGPPVARLGLTPAAAARGLTAFRASCATLTRRTDTSGLTRPGDWAGACAAARGWSNADATTFFATWFEAVEVGDGAAFVTGYYEPEIRGCRTRQPGCEVPVYARAPDMARPYFTRAQIEDGALAGRGLEIAWAADPVELFFLEIQGSGRLRMPDGSVMRIGYAAQNGRPFFPIGRAMRERGLITREQASAQGMKAWLHANPAAGRALMRENQSYIFFRELTGAGPLGALGIPVVGQVSAAVDPSYVPYGAAVVLGGMSDPRANGLWVAQDTGGAIRGANRFDTFWGAGEEAALISGGLQARGRALILLPRGTLDRLSRPDAPAQP